MRILPARLQRKRINNNKNNNDTARHRTVEYQQSDDASSSRCSSTTTEKDDDGDETPSSSISVMTIDSTKALILCEHHDGHHKHNGSEDDRGIISSSIQNDHNPHNDSCQELTKQDIFSILCGQNLGNDDCLPPTFSFCSNDDMDIIAFDCIEIPDNIPQLGSILTFDYDDDTSTLSNITTTSMDDDDEEEEAEIKLKMTEMGKGKKMTMTNLSPSGLWNANKMSKTIQEVLAIVVDSGYYDVFLNVCCDRLRYNATLNVCCCDGIGNIAIEDGDEEAATTTRTDGTVDNDVGGGTTPGCSLQFVMALDNNSSKNEPSQQQQPDAVKSKEYRRDNTAIWIPPFDDKMAFPLHGIEMTLMEEEDVPYSYRLEASYHDESSTNDVITLSTISKDCASEEDILSYYLPINNESTIVPSSSSTLFQQKMDHKNDTSAKDRATTDPQVDSQHRHLIKDEILLLSRKNTLKSKRKSFLFRLQRSTWFDRRHEQANRQGEARR